MSRARSAPGEAAPVPCELIEVRRLHAHEQVEPDLLERTIEEIKRDGYLKKPILVAQDDYVILDGHHRFEALRELGCQRIPCYLIDYFSDAVQLGLWPEATVRDVTKEEVVRRGLAGELFPPKTTRHIVRASLPEVITDLEDLL